MIKQLAAYLVGFAGLSFLGYQAHQLLFSQIASISPIDLKHLYLFFGGFSFALCTLFLVLSKTEKFRYQLGFLYLVSVALKIAIFCAVFSDAIFSSQSFTNKETVNLLIPMILMIVLEVVFISKLLNSFSPLKNDS